MIGNKFWTIEYNELIFDQELSAFVPRSHFGNNITDTDVAKKFIFFSQDEVVAQYKKLIRLQVWPKITQYEAAKE